MQKAEKACLRALSHCIMHSGIETNAVTENAHNLKCFKA
jgi:hypothetical protein